MIKALEKAYLQFLAGVMSFCGRRAGWTLLAAMLLSGGLLYYTIHHIAIDTNTLEMLDASLPFRQAKIDFDKSFPELSDDIIVLAESDTAAGANDLASKLATQLRGDKQHFDAVYEPASGPFFARNGLLYLEPDELQDLADTLVKAQPMLGTLAQDTSLRGIFTILGRAFDEDLEPEHQKVLSRIADDISKTAEAQLQGKPARTSWKAELFKDATPAGAGNKSFVLVRPKYDFTLAQPGAPALDAVRAAMRALPLNVLQHDRVRLTGGAAMDDDELSSVSEGAEVSSLLSFILVLMLTFFGLRSPRHVLAVVVTLLLGLIWTGAFATYAVGALNLISVNFAILSIGMGVDFGIQVGLRYKEEYLSSDDHLQALARSGAGIGGALTLAAVAAAACFASFAPTAYRGLAELGIIAAFSMVVALVSNLTLLPALLTLFPRWFESGPGADGSLSGLSWVVKRQRRMVLGVTAVLLLLALGTLPWLRFDFNPLNMKNPHTESVAAFIDLLQDPNITPYTISVLAKDVDTARELAKSLGQLAVVEKTVTVADLIPGDQANKLEIIDEINLSLGPLLEQSRQVAPTTDELVKALDEFLQKLAKSSTTKRTEEFQGSVKRLEQTLNQMKSAPGWPETALATLTDNVVADLPDSLEKLRLMLSPEEITLDNLPQEIKGRYIGIDGRARVEVFPKEDARDNAALQRFVHVVQTVAPQATSAPVELVEGGKAVVQAALEATALAVVATLAILYMVLRSFPDTLLVMVPLVLAMLLTVATSVVVGIPFDLANIIALPLLLALSNAYGIYFVVRVRNGMPIEKLFESSTPRAILFSALTTIVSFGTLAFSPHRGMSGMGIMVTLALVYAVLCTLIVLPALMSSMQPAPLAAGVNRRVSEAGRRNAGKKSRRG